MKLLKLLVAVGLRLAKGALVVAVLIASLLLSLYALERVRRSGMDAEDRLREDAFLLETILLREHPSPFANADRARVLDAVGRARAAAGTGAGADETVLAAFAEAVASLADPHTVILDRYERFGLLPVSWEFFGDELRVMAARGAPEGVLGARVLTLDGIDIEEALERIRRVVPYSTGSGFLDSAPRYLRTPGLLVHVGVAAGPDHVIVGVEADDGRRRELRLERIHPSEARSSTWPRVPPLPDAGLPLYRRRPDDSYWWELLPDEGVAYVRYRSSSPRADRGMGEIAAEVVDAVEGERAARVVVDIRGNGGGDPQLHLPLVQALASASELARPGAILVLTDGSVRSAGIAAVTELVRRTSAVVVGESVGDRASPTSDARPFTLPHSKLRLNVATLLMGGDVTPGAVTGAGRSRSEASGSAARGIPPDVAVTTTWEAWRGGDDPVLEAALAHRPRPPESAPDTLPAGRFAYDPLRDLHLRRGPSGGVFARATGLPEVRLHPTRSYWAGGPYRLRLSVEGRVERRSVSGAWLELDRRNAGEPDAPLARALSGRGPEARAALRRAAARHPEFRDLTAMGLVQEAHYLYGRGDAEAGRILVEAAAELHPDRALMHLQHSLLRREAGEGLLDVLRTALPAVGACLRRYRATVVENDLRLCL